MPYFANPVVNSLNTPSVTQDVIAKRPAAGIYGRWFHGTDDNILYWDNGTTWVAMTTGGGGGVTGSGTPPFLPKWDTTTDLNDSLLYQDVFQSPLEAIWNSAPYIANDVRSFFAKLLAPGINASETAYIIRDTLHSANIMEQLALAAFGAYTQLAHLYRVPDVLFWNESIGGTITLQANNTGGAHVAVVGELQVANDILGNADVSANNDLLANGNVAVGGTVSTGDPGSGAGDWQLGKLNTGVIVATGWAEVKIDGVVKKVLVG